MLAVVTVKARDRRGLLQDASAALKAAGANILASLGYASDGVARLVFIAESPRDPRELGAELERALRGDEAEVRAGEPGPEAAEALAELVAEKPGLLSVLEAYLAPADILDILLRLSEEERRRLYRFLSPETLAGILDAGDEAVAREVAGSVGPAVLARALQLLDPDEAVDVIQSLDPRTAKAVVSLLPREVREEVARLLRYPPDSAGGVMTTSVPVLRGDQTVQEALRALGRGGYDVNDTIVVVDGEGRLVGLADVNRLLSARPQERLGGLAVKPRVTVPPSADREEAAKLMLRYNVNRLPVVDERERFLGLITMEDVAYVLAEEAAEDISKLGGAGGPERYLTARVRDLVASRLPWLLLVYAVESVTATILKEHEGLIERAALVAAFIPLVMGTGGNVGSQASSMVLRALAVGEISESSRRDLALVAAKELASAAAIGAVLAAAGLALALAVSGEPRVAAAVAATLLITVILADLIGALLPVAARLAGVDPASISAPLVTTLMDVVVATIYITIASKLVLSAWP